MSTVHTLIPSRSLPPGSSSSYSGQHVASAPEPDLLSLIGRYDNVWDKGSSEYKIINPSENPYMAWEPPSKHEGTAFYVLRSFDEKGRNPIKTLVITSKYLCEIINTVLLDEKYNVIMHQTKVDPHALYHHLDDFRNFDFSLGIPAEITLDDPELPRVHLEVLIYFLDTEYQYDKELAETLLAINPPHISFDLLWLLFQPKSLILSGVKRHRLYTCAGTRTTRTSIELDCRYISFGSTSAGFSQGTLHIPKFQGFWKVTELMVYPFEFCTLQAQIERTLENRGHKYIDICRKGRQYVCHSGSGQDSPKGERRYVIDVQAYVDEEGGINDKLVGDLDVIHYQLCDSSLWAFSIEDQAWDYLYVDEFTDIVWKDEMLANVVLDSITKTMIKGLISQHSFTDMGAFKDIIPGKGSGMIMLFSGPPGVGKTLTAEAVAEAAHRPIYRISSNDLGCEPERLERNLTEILRRGAQLGIVLLLDEADVFLEQRTSFDVKRNSLVSIFLRELEYYAGTLILTTNRVETFDKALESRIHYNLRFPELNRASRLQLWQFFLKDRSDHISYWEMRQLAESKFNGRMIKNAVYLGLSLAKIQGESLSYAHINNGLRFIDPSLTTEPSAKRNDYNYASPLDPAMTPGQPIDVLGGNRGIADEFIHPESSYSRRAESIEQNGSEGGRGSKRARRS